jgi:DNA-binding beta-propeller fold protein YncE
MKITKLGLFLGLSLGVLPVTAQTDWAVVKTFPVGGQGSWDYLTVDERTHRLYVPRTSHTLVLDSETGKTIADIPGQKGAHGVALAPKVGRGFITDGGGDGSVVVFDMKTNAVLGALPGVPDVDGIIFDPHSGNVLVVSGRGKALYAFKPDVDLKTGSLGEPIALRGEPEFLAADASGKAYINLMDTNEVAVADLNQRKIVDHWPVAPAGAPVGMIIDEKKGLLFIGCRKPAKLIAMSTKDGKVTASMPIGESVDAVKIDGGQVFASTAGSQLFVAGEKTPGNFEIAQTVKTGEGARTMAIDSSIHQIYLPAAEYTTDAKGKRTQKPGSFTILVVERAGKLTGK